MKHAEVTECIISCYYSVYNQLGYGFLEKVYERALQIELQKSGLQAEAQFPIKVIYAGQVVGEYYVDLIVNKKVQRKFSII